MASTKKQDKPSTAPEQAVPAPAAPASADQGLASPPSGSNATVVDAAETSTAIAGPVADPGANAEQEAGGPTTEVPVELAPVATSAEDAAGAAADVAGLDESTSSVPVELNPATVEVYPLRSFLDEGELRRRRGPGYLVPRRHAEELELRKLVSRTPLEE
ncbi:hypothetical protein [Pseudomonas alabamensis]|uniref:hypothetical protein n=1 Tax=Pseudomonas alabamensis TaxID=3064349 RepID=UPI003F64A042